MPVHVFTRKRRGLYTKMSKKNKHLKLIIRKQQQIVYPKKKKFKKEREKKAKRTLCKTPVWNRERPVSGGGEGKGVSFPKSTTAVICG